MFSSINLWAVIVGAIVAFVLGFLLHGPVAGKLWMKLADVHPTGNEKFSDMIPQMIWNLIANFFSALALAVVYGFAYPSLGSYGVWGGVVCGVIVWAGFLVTGSSMEVIWMKRKMSLWLFECMCSLIVMSAMGIVIALW